MRLACILLISSVVASCCLLTACDNHTVYYKYQTLSPKGWEKDDTLTFRVKLNDSLPATLRLFTELRNTHQYPYRELYLSVSQNLQDSTTWHTDTLTVMLADSTGKPVGKGLEALFQTETYVTSAHSPHPGDRTVKVVHCMSDLLLQGINDVGIRIEKR